MSVHDIDWSCPADLEPYAEVYRLERNEKDIQQWQLGQYMAAAVSCVFPKGKYPKKPMFQIKDFERESIYKESQEEVAVFEMKQRINLLRQSGLPESPM